MLCYIKAMSEKLLSHMFSIPVGGGATQPAVLPVRNTHNLPLNLLLPSGGRLRLPRS